VGARPQGLLISLFRGIEATRDGADVELGGPRQRAVLALLAHRPRTTVSTSALIDGLWGDAVPDSALKTLRSYLSRLRSALGDEAICTTSGGYVLDVPDEAIDAMVLSRCVGEARRLGPVDPDRAAGVLRDGLALCPAPALDRAADAPGVAMVSASLEENRLGAIELLMDLEVARGRGSGAVAELERLVADHPYRERLWAALMRALYQAGRHADALARFQRFRRLLEAELGLVPGPDLRELEAAILSHDPVLAAGDEVPMVPRYLAPLAERRERSQSATRYAKTADGVHIAYQIVGDGPVDLVFFGPPVSHVELGWEHPAICAFYRELASFSRLILFDKRGVGMSDPTTAAATLEQRMDDVRTVMDAAGSESAVMFGTSDGGQLGVLMANRHPRRVTGLVFYSTFARVLRNPDYPLGVSEDLFAAFLDLVERDWGGDDFIGLVIPSFLADEALTRRFRRFVRHSCSPGGAVAQFVRCSSADVRDLLAGVHVPTLVMHAADEQFIRAVHGRYMATRIPGAEYVELPGADHLPYGDNAAAVVERVRTFLRELKSGRSRPAATIP